MNAKTIVLLTAFAVPLCAQAESDIPTTDPVQAVDVGSLKKSCSYSTARPMLRPSEIARGFGRQWDPSMRPLRKEALAQARKLCDDGYTGVEFKFQRGARPQDLAIAAGNGAGEVDATP